MHPAARNWKKSALIVIVLTLLTVLFAPAAPAAEHRIKVRVDEPFEVNGRMYAAGTLTLRHLGDYNPTATLNELWVEGECLGMLLAVESAGGHVAGSDSVIFSRAADGRLVLKHVAFRGEPVRELYAYVEQADGDRWVVPRAESTVPAALIVAR